MLLFYLHLALEIVEAQEFM